MKRGLFRLLVLCCITIVCCLLSISGYADNLNDDQRTRDMTIFDAIDACNPKSEYQIRFRNNANLQSDGGGACNVSAITTLLNRRLAADYQSGTFTVSNVLTSLNCKNIYTDGKLYSDKNFGTSGTKLFQYYYWTGTSSTWCVGGTNYSNGSKSYTISQIKGSTIKSKTDKAGFNAYIASLLHDHPEGIAIRNTKANHVVVIYRYSYSNGTYTLYVKDPVGNTSRQLSSSYMGSLIGNDLYSNVDFIVYINGVCAMATDENLSPYENLSVKPEMSGGTAPISLSNGSSFWLKGTITCECNITEVRGEVYNCTTNTKIYDVAVPLNSKSYTLGSTGEVINDSLKFGDSRLNNSWCRYTLKVTYDKNGTPCEKYMIDRYFTVGNAASMTLLEPGYYEFVCDEEIRTGPAESNTLVRTCKKGTVVYVTGYETNSYHNIWVKVLDGYIFSGDVRKIEGSGAPSLVEEIHISTPEGLEDENIEYIGYDDDNKQVVFQAYVMPVDAYNSKVSWASSDSNVLRWDRTDDEVNAGYFTITGVGQTNVTATAMDGSDISRTISLSYYISDLTMPTSSVDLNVGGTWTACPVIVPSIAKNSDLNWTSSNTQVATVDSNGLVTAVASGSATITATPKSGTVADNNPIDSVSCSINVASASILSFNNIKYPDPYKISTSGYVWGDNSGTITSRDGLSSVEFNIYDKDGERIAQYINTQNVNTLTLKSITKQIKMSALTTEGYSNFEIIATDVNNHVLKASVKFYASNSQSTVSNSFSRTYMTPILLASKSYGNSDYYLYKSHYTWDAARDFAQAHGGYLATITDSGENAAVAEMISSRNIGYAYIGGYYNGSSYVWVTDENMEYTNWAVNQPDHRATRENYMEIFGTRIEGDREIGQWNDIESASYARNYFIVEIPKFDTFGECGQNATWSFRNNTLTISGTGDMYDYFSCFETPWSIYREQIYSVVVSDGITSIGDSAFDGFINLESAIILPDSVTSIGDYAFSECVVNIPANVSWIGTCSEVGCYFVVDSDNLYFSSVDGSLYNKDKTRLIKYNPWAESFDLPVSVSQFADGAFAYCNNLTAVTIPDLVTAIPSNAFEMCLNLETAIIPGSVTSIGNYAFWSCPNLTSITIPRNVSSIGWDIFYHYEGMIIFCYDDSAAHAYAVENRYDYILLDTPLNNPDFVIPAFTTSIESEAFYGIAAKRVKLQGNVSSIGSMAFAYCPNLVSIYIPGSCTSIAGDAFAGVPGLTIYGKEDSYAESYAIDNDYFFVGVD